MATVLPANATGTGNGGEVVVLVNDSTTFTGAISVAGGPLGGNGGFVETSSHNYLLATGSVTADGSAGGAMGTWLLDPHDVNIENSGTTGGSFDGGTPTNTFTTNGGGTGVSVADRNTIQNSLKNGVNVVIETSGGGSGNGQIDVQDNVTMAGVTAGTTATLTLQADANIKIDSGVTISATQGTLNLVLTATTGVDIEGAVSLNGGTFTSSGVNFLMGTTGSVAAASAGITHTGTVEIDGTLNVGTGTLTVSGTAYSQALGTNTITAGTVNLTATSVTAECRQHAGDELECDGEWDGVADLSDEHLYCDWGERHGHRSSGVAEHADRHDDRGGRDCGGGKRNVTLTAGREYCGQRGRGVGRGGKYQHDGVGRGDRGVGHAGAGGDHGEFDADRERNRGGGRYFCDGAECVQQRESDGDDAGRAAGVGGIDGAVHGEQRVFGRDG